MKRLRIFTLLIIATLFFTTSCESDDTLSESFDSALLIGKWQRSTEFYLYNSNGGGKTWDTADDVSEDEAQSFTWTLVKSELTHIHIMQMGGNIPKVYTVIELTATTLKYRDDYNKTFSFTKVN
ncbi:MAG: lipocalin family protein [Bacteroidaceae bacterium]|nr:lipocalin family protein [Bacteroidaceae bacterium]